MNHVGINKLLITFLSITLAGTLNGTQRKTGEQPLTRPSPVGRASVACDMQAADALRPEACLLINSLVPQDPQNLPQWEDTWENKCDLVVLDCEGGTALPPALQPQKSERADDNKRALQLRAFFAARAPVQFMQNPPDFGDQTHSLPGLASVLFNKVASDAITQQGAKYVVKVNKGQTPTLPVGSVIAKAIWGMYGVGQDGKISETDGTFFVSTMTDADENALNDLSVPAPTNPHSTSTSSRDSVGWVPNPFDLSRYDPECTTAGQQLPLSCMHSFLIDASQDTHGHWVDKSVGKYIASMPKADRDLLTTACHNGLCRIILMGIHFMERVPDDDPAREADIFAIRSPWIFMTLWWTGHDNRMNLPAPWKYFEMRVTQNLRNDRLPDGSKADRHIAFNPYLEGLSPNGPYSNCASCHQYAAYNRSFPARSPAACGAGPNFGFARIPADPADKPFPATNTQPDCPSAQDYLRRGIPDFVDTDFVWSFAKLHADTSRRSRQNIRRWVTK